ncbi:MAG TPA: UbiA-like polyprenyltransferase [Candidatus Eremiobacteraeota bacterium]|nr:UbiA-like polyprenyltransferase [Candidatus Eremiobacteraeota bacterium]
MNIKNFIDLVRLEQTLFALPFAYLGVIAGAGGVPEFSIWFWVTLAMFGARTAGMSLNRIIDMDLDGKNPRTAGRLLPSGKITKNKVWLITFLSLALLVFSSWMLNPLCFKLSPVAVILLWFYSYCKRFTWATHLVLGLVESAAPIGGWLAVTGEWNITPFFLGSAIIFWMTGLDIIYACQDYEFDRKERIFSIPANFGLERALFISSFSHILTVFFLIVFGIAVKLGIIYYCGVTLTGMLFIYEHRLINPADLKHVNRAFFTVNSWISIVIFIFTLGDILL